MPINLSKQIVVFITAIMFLVLILYCVGIPAMQEGIYKNCCNKLNGTFRYNDCQVNNVLFTESDMNKMRLCDVEALS